VDPDRARHVGEVDAAVVGVDDDIAVDVAHIDAVVVDVDVDVDAPGYLDAVRHQAPHRSDDRTGAVELERGVDHLVAESGVTQTVGDLRHDVDLVGVGTDDAHRSGVVVDRESGQPGRRHGEALRPLLVGEQLDDVDRSPGQRGEQQHRAEHHPQRPTARRPRPVIAVEHGLGRRLVVDRRGHVNS
jgi:hypothetical protein